MPDNDPGGASATTTQQPRRGASDAGQGDGVTSEQPSSQDTVHDPIAKAVADAEYKARQERRALEKKLAEFESAQQQAEEAKLSEMEKATKKIADLEAKLAESAKAHQEYLIGQQVEQAAKALGITPALADRILDRNALDLDKETGQPTNIAALLQAALEQYGLAQPPNAAQAQAMIQTAPSAPQVGATNPSRASQVVGSNGIFGPNEIPKLTDRRLWKNGNS